MNEKERRKEELRENLLALEQRKLELMALKDGLEELKRKGSFKLLIPFGGGIYFEGKVDDLKEAFVNVGSGVFLKKNIDEALEMIENNIREIERTQAEIRKLIEQLG